MGGLRPGWPQPWYVNDAGLTGPPEGQWRIWVLIGQQRLAGPPARPCRSGRSPGHRDPDSRARRANSMNQYVTRPPACAMRILATVMTPLGVGERPRFPKSPANRVSRVGKTAFDHWRLPVVRTGVTASREVQRLHSSVGCVLLQQFPPRTSRPDTSCTVILREDVHIRSPSDCSLIDCRHCTTESDQ